MYFYIIIIIYSSCRHKAIKILVNIKKSCIMTLATKKLVRKQESVDLTATLAEALKLLMVTNIFEKTKKK